MSELKARASLTELREYPWADIEFHDASFMASSSPQWLTVDGRRSSMSDILKMEVFPQLSNCPPYVITFPAAAISAFHIWKES